eukprot:CAMPEP_0197520434 /NCGR_PEP_ID=MMETSP1318-20131121/5782_1 /TAXON_ID=552666 /ORGANISM="Partenskyella glossopodia, Strain RCC365" /LENGTH=338 /DNA_ID=CAMNT_0043071997 /DNA_START=31 /DNA_END=1047 /DNA_ORIENTATION=+
MAYFKLVFAVLAASPIWAVRMVADDADTLALNGEFKLGFVCDEKAQEEGRCHLGHDPSLGAPLDFRMMNTSMSEIPNFRTASPGDVDFTKTRPKDLCWTQDSITTAVNSFDDNHMPCKMCLMEVAKRIADKKVSFDVFPALRIFYAKNRIFSLDNRRLFLFKLACQINPDNPHCKEGVKTTWASKMDIICTANHVMGGSMKKLLNFKPYGKSKCEELSNEYDGNHWTTKTDGMQIALTSTSLSGNNYAEKLKCSPWFKNGVLKKESPELYDVEKERYKVVMVPRQDMWCGEMGEDFKNKFDGWVSFEVDFPKKGNKISVNTVRHKSAIVLNTTDIRIR